jgi:hypothetical protein
LGQILVIISFIKLILLKIREKRKISNIRMAVARFVKIMKRTTDSGTFQTRSERATANGALPFVSLKFYVSLLFLIILI